MPGQGSTSNEGSEVAIPVADSRNAHKKVRFVNEVKGPEDGYSKQEREQRRAARNAARAAKDAEKAAREARAAKLADGEYQEHPKRLAPRGNRGNNQDAARNTISGSQLLLDKYGPPVIHNSKPKE